MTNFPDLEVVLAELDYLGLRIKDVGLLASALSRPQASAFGADAYPDFELKAAALLHSMIKNHPMIDGNKRAAWIVLNFFCALNDYDIVVGQDDAFAFIIGVATDQRDLPAMAAWLAQHLVKVGLNGD